MFFPDVQVGTSGCVLEASRLQRLQHALQGVSCWKLMRIRPSPQALHDLCASSTMQHVVCVYVAGTGVLEEETQLQYQQVGTHWARA